MKAHAILLRTPRMTLRRFGAADIEDLELAGSPARVWERLAEMVDELGSAGIGSAGLSDVGAVVGATRRRKSRPSCAG